MMSRWGGPPELGVAQPQQAKLGARSLSPPAKLADALFRVSQNEPVGSYVVQGKL